MVFLRSSANPADMKLGEDRRVDHCTVGNPVRPHLEKQLGRVRASRVGMMEQSMLAARGAAASSLTL